MAGPHIVFLDRNSLPVDLPAFDFPHRYTAHLETSPEQVLEHAKDADILISNKVVLSQTTLAQLPKLKHIAVSATGVNIIDLAACQALGISVSNVRHYGDETVAEHAFMLMLALSRNLLAYHQDVLAGAWSKSDNFCYFGAPIEDLMGKTLTIVGRGGIGQALGRRAEAFGMRVLFAEREGSQTVRAGLTEFESALRAADVLSLHCPYIPNTPALIGERELSWLKPSAILINTARGALVDALALLAALHSKQLAGAALDVLVEEPPSPDHPLLLANLPNLIVTPHVAWGSFAAMSRLAAQVVANIRGFCFNKPFNQVV